MFAAVELARQPLERSNRLDLRMTLYGSQYQPTVAYWMTGAQDPMETLLDISSERRAEQRRVERSTMLTKRSSAHVLTRGYLVGEPWVGTQQEELSTENLALTHNTELLLFSHLAFVPAPLRAANSAETSSLAVPLDGAVDDEANTPLELRDFVPPWNLMECITEMAATVLCRVSHCVPFSKGASCKVVDGFSDGQCRRTSLDEGEGALPSNVVLVSHTSETCGDVARGVFFVLDVDEVKFFPRYFLPPWKHRIGLPAGLKGRPCLAMRCVVHQGGIVAVRGTFFFTLAEHQI